MDELNIKNSRRKFIKNALGAGFLLASGVFPFDTFAKEQYQKLSILHTNDVHSRLEPFPKNSGRYSGRGGIAKRASLIAKIRQQNENVLLLDAGDIFQGTPYFNYYKGEPEIKLMSALKYDAATLGNHDFDAGIDGFNTQLPHASFPFICSNYNFKNTILEGKTLDYKVFTKKRIKIGIFGLGIKLEGLVPKTLYKETQYLDPLEIAKDKSQFLKNEKKCDFIICLSHLGYNYQNDKISDHTLAKKTKNIDLIIGGHTHTFLSKPVEIKNAENKITLVNQVGWAGLQLGKLDFYFEKKSKKYFHDSNILDI